MAMVVINQGGCLSIMLPKKILPIQFKLNCQKIQARRGGSWTQE